MYIYKLGNSTYFFYHHNRKDKKRDGKKLYGGCMIKYNFAATWPIQYLVPMFHKVHSRQIDIYSTSYIHIYIQRWALYTTLHICNKWILQCICLQQGKVAFRINQNFILIYYLLLFIFLLISFSILSQYGRFIIVPYLNRSMDYIFPSKFKMKLFYTVLISKSKI